MSGVEIAGFVLAVIPLMISALEDYRETEEVLSTWWKIKREYQKCKRNLKYHKIAFEETLEELLLPLIVDEWKLQALLENPGGPLWKDPELEALLQQRMPKTYSSYLDTIEMMSETVQSLHDALGTGKVHFQSRVANEQMPEKSVSGTRATIAHVTQLGMANMEWQTQRIKLAFNKTTRDELFKEFGDLTTRLRDILGSSDRLAGLRRARASNSSGIDAGLWKFWNHGSNLFKLLTEAWACQCQTYHHANLLLQHRVSPAVHFRVIFWFTKQLAGSHSPWTWQDTSIELLSSPPISTTQAFNASPGMNATTNESVPSSPMSIQLRVQPPEEPKEIRPPAKMALKSHRKFFMDKFRSPKSPDSLLLAHSTKTTANPEKQLVTAVYLPKSKVSFAEVEIPPAVEDSPKSVITNLCTNLSQCPSDLSDLGCLKGDTNQYIVRPTCTSRAQPQKHLTLETLLSNTSPVSISRRQRFQVALILASSHIQLHPTPWLKAKWSKQDILFLYDAEDSNKISIDHPYISRSVAKSIEEQGNNPAANTLTYSFQDSIRNLGIMLLELCFGKAIEDHRLRKGLNIEDEQTLAALNYYVADKWSADVVEEAGPEYADAVNWCLHHVPDTGTVQGEKDRWREDMFAKVVEPLKYCHDQLVAV